MNVEPVNVEPVKVEPARLDHPAARRLIGEVQAYYAKVYGGQDGSPMADDEFDAPHGRFFLARDGEQYVGMGGWRRRPDLDQRFGGTTVELKRMYVAPDHRRRGVSAMILGALERTAREAHADFLILETGLAQPEAIAFYEAHDYQPTEPFGHYAWSELNRCFAKRLS